jgi:hypothetical protein
VQETDWRTQMQNMSRAEQKDEPEPES